MQAFCLEIIQNYFKSWRKVYTLDSLNSLKQEHREMIIYKFRLSLYVPVFSILISSIKLLKLKNQGYFKRGFDPVLDEVWGTIVCMFSSVSLAVLISTCFTYQLFNETDVLFEEYCRLGKISKIQIELVENPPPD